MHTRLFILVLFISCVGFLFVSCGFYSMTGASIPAKAETISISHFPNHARNVQPTLSQRFTEELREIFVRRTSLNLVESGGDLHFEGYISEYSTRPVSVEAGDVAAQNRLTISVSVVFDNYYDPDSSFERTFSRYYDYPSRQSLSQVEDQAISIITEELVEDIFNQSVVDW